MDLICLRCARYGDNHNMMGCLAQPNGIPEHIATENKHDEAQADLEGKFTFDPS